MRHTTPTPETLIETLEIHPGYTMKVQRQIQMAKSAKSGSPPLETEQQVCELLHLYVAAFWADDLNDSLDRNAKEPRSHAARGRQDGREARPETEEVNEREDYEQSCLFEAITLKPKARPDTIKRSALPKRRAESAIVVTNSSSPSKRQKPTASQDHVEAKKAVVSSLRESTFIPKDFHQPSRIYEVFLDRCSATDDASISILTRLFFVIGSPMVFHQLREMFLALRENSGLPMIEDTKNLRQTVGALDNLDTRISATTALRRIFLASLKAHRLELEKNHREGQSHRRRKSSRHPQKDIARPESKTDQVFDRADAQALRSMMVEAYPDLQPTSSSGRIGRDEYQRKLAALKERLRSGRNWELMQKEFGPSILLLVPTNSAYGIRDFE